MIILQYIDACIELKLTIQNIFMFLFYVSA